MKIFKLSLLLAFVAIFASCEEKERAFPEFGDEDLGTGAYARRIDGVNGVYNFFDIDGAMIDATVEFYDLNEGRDVAFYNWTATHINNAEGGDNTGPVEVLSIPASEFGTSEFGLPSATVNFDLASTLAALNLELDDINGGDAIRYEATIVMNDGREFNRFNTGGNVVGGNSFRALFLIDQAIVCPSELAGTYDYVTVGTSTDGCCPDETTVTGTIELTDATGLGNYDIFDFSGGLYGFWYDIYGVTPEFVEAGNLTQRLIDACGNISIPEFTEPFGETASATGSIDLDSGVITYTWVNGFGDTGTVTLTPQ